MKPQKNLLLIGCLIFSFILSSCSSSFMVVDTPKVMPPPRVLKSKPRVAVVLGGGAFLGLAHLGVLKVLEENVAAYNDCSDCNCDCNGDSDCGNCDCDCTADCYNCDTGE